MSISDDSINFAILAALLGLATQVLPTFGSARTTIVRYKTDSARSLRSPAWQRLFLDAVLLGVVSYGYYQMRERGSFSILGVGVSAGGDPLREPILFIAPSLFVFALALIGLRFFPITMAGLSSLSLAERHERYWVGSEIGSTAHARTRILKEPKARRRATIPSRINRLFRS